MYELLSIERAFKFQYSPLVNSTLHQNGTRWRPKQKTWSTQCWQWIQPNASQQRRHSNIHGFANGNVWRLRYTARRQWTASKSSMHAESSRALYWPQCWPPETFPVCFSLKRFIARSKPKLFNFKVDRSSPKRAMALKWRNPPTHRTPPSRTRILKVTPKWIHLKSIAFLFPLFFILF